MFYRKKLNVSHKSSSTYLISSFSSIDSSHDESVTPLKKAVVSYNFDTSDGSLSDGFGVKECNFNGYKPLLPQGITALKCYHYRRYDYDESKRDDRILIYASDGYIYEFYMDGDKTTVKKENLYFTTKPYGLCYRYNGNDVILLSSAEDGLKIYDGINVPMIVSEAPQITSMCIHSERLFVTCGGDKTSLYFSDDFDPANWYVSLGEGGYIDAPSERGALNKVVSFLNYVYIFATYGILRLTAYGDQTQFTLTPLYVSGEEIYGASVTVCGDRIIFMTKNGLYQFDGVYTTKVAEGLDGLLYGTDKSSCRGEFCNGKLYLSCNLNHNEKDELATIVYLPVNKTFYISSIKADDVTKISRDDGSRLLFVCDGKIGELSDIPREFDKPLEKIWKSPFSDLNYAGRRKLIREIRLICGSDGFLIIESDEEKRRISLTAHKGYISYKVCVKGTRFSFTFGGNRAGGKISKPVVSFDLL